MARLYSYIRFSTPEQAQGSSSDRQSEYAERYAAENGLQLDTSLNMKDEGLSAYHQAHIKKGALGVFLQAVEAGKVPSGSTLIIEALDRLSRAEPIEAQAILYQIINAGIAVVTASDGKRYDREGLKANPMDLVYSVLVMIRAHEESETKSSRVNAAIRIACEDWISGKKRTHVRNGKPPGWVRETGSDVPPLYEFIPERVEALRLAVKLYLSGEGGTAIAKRLNAEGMRISNGPVSGQNLYRIFKNPMMIGAKVLRVADVEYVLDDYYPAAISEGDYEKLKSSQRSRPRAPGAGIPGIFTGVGICSCGYCGASMQGVNYANRARADGSLADGHRRLQCADGLGGGGRCPIGGGVSLAVVERALLTYCRSELGVAEFTEQDDTRAKLAATVADRRAALDAIAVKLDKLAAALLETDEVPLVLIRKMRELEKDQAAARDALAAAENDLKVYAGAVVGGLLDEWQALTDAVMTLDKDARMKARQLFMATFERIDVYGKGFGAEGFTGVRARVAERLSQRLLPGKGVIDIRLKFRSGAVRLLRIDRLGKGYVSAADF